MIIDHILTDGVSNGILCNDLWKLYAAGAQGREANLKQIHLHFQDYAEWQWRCFPTWLRRHAPYWRRHLNSVKEIHWPVDSHVELPQSGAFGSVRLLGDEHLLRQLDRVSRELRTLPAMVVLAAYVATISCWCDQKELVVSVVDTGRHRPELHQMVGCLADHLHLKIEVRCHEAFDQLLSTLFDEYRLSYENRDYGWLNLVVHEPVADVYFNYRTCTVPREIDSPYGSDGLKSLTIEPYLNHNAPERHRIAVREILPYKLGATVRAHATFLDFNLGYDGKLFAKDVMHEVGSTIMSLLKEALHNPRQRVEVLFDLAKGI